MSADNFLEAGFESGGIQVASQAIAEWHVVERAAWFHLIEKPQALLSKG